MLPRPPITISVTDFHRLHALLEQHPDTDVADGLLDELDRARLLEPAQMPASVVAMNSRVRFLNEDLGREYIIELVYPRHAGQDCGRVSILTPAGAALLGLSAGDRIEWPAADGRPMHLQLLEVMAPAAAAARPA